MVSVKAAVMVITVLTLCLWVTRTSAAHRECCLRYMKKKLPFFVIKGYSVQDKREMCPINAIIFHTRKGKTCTDPKLNWVMHYVNLLRQERAVRKRKEMSPSLTKVC
uniref:C-C motif chemokine n=1 Tax=Cynoglossus semilaevis TaxID=244447 RepID=A0A3P8W9Y7_CYNSE